MKPVCHPWIIALALAAIVVPARAQDDRPWQSLFDGKTLDGWTVKCKPADASRNFWKVDDGAILADSLGAKGHNYIWLVTNKEYADFALKLRFQSYRNSPGNSGVQLRSRYDDAAGWLDGPQIDINPPAPWRTGMMWDETRGNQRWIYPDLPQGKWVDQSMAAPGLKFFFSDDTPAWNDLQITAAGNKITAILNGVTITNYNAADLFDDDTHKQRNVGPKGFIALQIHTGDQLKIRYKDIYIQQK